MTKIAADPSHPRYQSLLLRHRLEEAEKKGRKLFFFKILVFQRVGVPIILLGPFLLIFISIIA